MIPILHIAKYWDLDLVQEDTHKDACNEKMMCLTKMMMQRCVWDFLPAGAVSVRLTRPSGSSTCSIEPLILARCGIDFLFFLCLCLMWDCISICLCLCCLCFLCLFFLFGFGSIKPLILAGCWWDAVEAGILAASFWDDLIIRCCFIWLKKGSSG